MSRAVVYFALQPLRSLRAPRSPGQQLDAAPDHSAGASRRDNATASAALPAVAPCPPALPDTGAHTARQVRLLLDLPESFEIDDL